MEQANRKARSLNALRSLLITNIMVICSFPLFAQEPSFETFPYEHGDSTIIMQKYFLVFLKQGPNRSQDEAEASRIQKEHLAYLGDLFEKGVICMNGPFGDDGSIRGATVYRTATLEEAKKLAGNDPAVKAGRLEVEVHPWWLARGSGVR
ncbi:MAG: hypothetical protein KTR24_06515 [Saprospiraceae bacterium]|nr:hypothetical protein [Saprospiraceae bacterium]